jgi:hypothetical protein
MENATLAVRSIWPRPYGRNTTCYTLSPQFTSFWEMESVRRRDFIKAIAGSTVAWPFVARAQSAEHVRLIGMLNILGPDDPEAQARHTVFAQILQQLGWAVGSDLKIEIRQVGGDLDRLSSYAAELIALAPDVIVSVGSVAL